MKNLACFVALLALTACSNKNNASTDAGTRTDTGAGDLGTSDTGVVTDAGEDNDAEVLTDGGSGSCASATNCADCVAMPSCGFCPGMGCFESNSEGPNLADGGTGTCEGFAWLSNECPGYDAGPPPTCEASPTATCGECTAAFFCGWCPSLGCVSGTSSGPYGDGGVATCEGWAYVPSSCPDYDAGVIEDAGVDLGPPAGDAGEP